ncbi:alpha/beta fold hydrolase [Alkalicoccus luteus]|uniref:Alpha/beta hydrolase n=1 Tax=Alkalicoccus luteus TaxID=1237094 RepID=A0A969PQN5_9BACI|nr:alpha/beta hydrolase [Alkalicoccus luteus]NJP38607.1 alpha/beta hydrolase [Alkalicoccus luteus]
MYIDLAHGRLHYHESGEGRPVILLHGWGAEVKTMMPVHKALEPHFHVYTLDLPGFGESDEPDKPWDTTDYSRALREFVEKTGIEQPIIAGHSHGGRTAIHYAAEYGDVHKLILIDAAGIKPKRKPSYYAKVYSYKTAKQLLKLPGLSRYREDILNKMKGRVGSADYKNVSGTMQQTLVKVVNDDFQHLMPSIQASTLLIFGEQDTATPVSHGQQMEKLIPDAGLVVLKNAGHFAYLDQPQQFNAVLHSFLENDKRRSS